VLRQYLIQSFGIVYVVQANVVVSAVAERGILEQNRRSKLGPRLNLLFMNMRCSLEVEGSPGSMEARLHRKGSHHQYSKL